MVLTVSNGHGLQSQDLIAPIVLPLGLRFARSSSSRLDARYLTREGNLTCYYSTPFGRASERRVGRPVEPQPLAERVIRDREEPSGMRLGFGSISFALTSFA